MKYELGQEVRVEGIMRIEGTELSDNGEEQIVLRVKTADGSSYYAHVPESWVSPLEVPDETV